MAAKKSDEAGAGAGWSDHETAFFSAVTPFQAQMVRDAFCEGGESDESVAERTGIPLDVVRLGHLCRLRTLVRAEITARDLKKAMVGYQAPDKIRAPGVRIPRCARQGKTLSHVLHYGLD